MIKKNIVINVGARLATTMLSIIFAPIYLKLYGVEAYGLVAIYGLLQSIFLMADMGLTTALLQKIAHLKLEPQLKPQIVRIYLTLESLFAFIGGLVCIMLYLGAGYIARNWISLEAIPLEIAIDSIKLMAFAICLQTPFMLAQAGLTGLEKFMSLNIVNIVISIMRTAGVVAIFQINQTLEIFFLWHVLVTIFQAFLGYILIRKALEIKINEFQFNISSITPMWKFASGGAAITITGFILIQADKFLLTKMVSVKEFGLYSLATVVAAMPSLIAFPIKTSLQPRLVQLIRNGTISEITRFYETACVFIAAVSIPMCMMLILFPREILYILTGDTTVAESAYLLVSVMSVGTLFMCLMLIPFTLQLAYEWTSLTIYSNIISIIVFIPLAIFLVTKYGMIGASFLMLFVYIFQFFILTVFMHSYIFKKIYYSWYLKTFLFPVAIVLLFAIPARYVIDSIESRLSGILVLSLLGGFLLIVSFIYHRELRTHTLVLLKIKKA